MKWEVEDLKVYYQSKEYIDTVCIPLVPVSFKSYEDATKLAGHDRSLHILASELERHFTGRIMLSPTYTYMKKASTDTEAKRLNQWVNEMFEKEFAHIFLLTFDIEWKKEEKLLESPLIWLPATLIDNQPSEESKKWVQEQTNQISELIQSYW